MDRENNMSQDLDLEKQQKSDDALSNGLRDPELVDSNSTKSGDGDGEQEKNTASPPEQNPNIVDWDGAQDPKHPRNWSMGRKWAAISVVSSFVLITPMASSMTAPALPQISRDLGIKDEVLSQMSLSIFVLAYAVGPLILAPLSELYGRVPVLQIANLFFLVFNLVCGFAQTTAQLLVFRFLAGLGGAAPIGIGGGVMGDCFAAEDRGKAVAIYTLGPILGPALGPIAGGFISEHISWRWIFWIVSMFTALVQAVGFFLLQETNPTVLLNRKAKRLRQETGNEALYAKGSEEVLPLAEKLKISLSRPFRLLFTQPIVICMALYMAYIYGLMYLVISTITTLFETTYYERTEIAGLNFIALAIGFVIGLQGTSFFVDRVYRKLKKRNNNEGLPEFRILIMIPGAILTPIGLFWYGWSAQAATHWIVPDIGIAIFAAAVMCGNMAIQTYIIDAYTKYAASAIAAIACLRSLAGFGFPLFAPYMYSSLGYGWGNSVLAFIAIALGIPSPWFFWHYGARLRAKSPFAAGE